MPDLQPSPEVVLAHLDSLPTLPPVALRILQVTADQQSGAADVVALLRNDQSLTARLLTLGNSAATGAASRVTTIEKAISVLGFAVVRSVVLATSVFDCFGEPAADDRQAAFAPREFWKHALAVGCVARRLAAVHPRLGVDPEEAFVAGLLHDLGKVALATVFPKAYERAACNANEARGDIADCERALLGVDHTVAGRRLAERWRLPRALQDAVWLHHLALDAVPPSVSQPALIGLVQLADTLAREQRIGYSGNHRFYEFSPALAARAGFSDADLAGVIETLAQDVAQNAALLGIDDESPVALYTQAMTRANAELGRLNADLLLGNRRLAAGARYFKAIAAFEQHLSDWSDPGAVAVALAEAASGALQLPRLAAFGWRHRQVAIDVCVRGAEPAACDARTYAPPPDLAACGAALEAPAGAPALPAPAPVCRLVAELLGVNERGPLWLLPVFHANELIGGIVYASEQDERARLSGDAAELRSFLASMGLALGRANAQTATRRLSEDLAETNRRMQQMQNELVHSRMLATIAEMAAGAGHELNGPLTVISGRAQMLAAVLSDPEARRALTLIVDKAHECSGIVSELMDFARPRPPQLESVDLPALLGDVREEWLSRTGAPASRCRLDLSPRAADDRAATLVANADPRQLRLVLRELINNAADAIDPEAGVIVLRCRQSSPPQSIELVVQDNGCGMSPAVLQRAFDPFYSHRNAGRSRGLGLPRAYRIVEGHGGKIWLESRPGGGTTAHVVLRADTSASVDTEPRRQVDRPNTITE